jgi:hypothetical protein
MILDTPHDDCVEISSSSYGLSLFLSKTGSHHDEGVGATPGESPSVSIGELWPGIDRLDDVGPEGTSMTTASNLQRSLGSGRIAEVPSCAYEGMVGASGPLSSAVPRGCGGGSARDRAA